jgi:hypothetical protein
VRSGPAPTVSNVTVAPRARTASHLDPLASLQAVRDVAELADTDDPARVSTRAWDAARPRSERDADAPPARRICEHLGLPWGKVRELAFMSPNGRSIALGHALNQQQGGWLTAEYSDVVLALVARRRGVPTLTPGEYRAERGAMLAADDRRRAHGRQLRLPTEHQIEAKANGIPLPRKERGRAWSDYLREWKEGRTAKGLRVPNGPPPKAQRPNYAQDVGSALPGERRQKKSWEDLDEVVEWVMRYLAELQRGERASQRGYNDWARQQGGAPWSAAFNQHGGMSPETGCAAVPEAAQPQPKRWKTRRATN